MICRYVHLLEQATGCQPCQLSKSLVLALVCVPSLSLPQFFQWISTHRQLKGLRGFVREGCPGGVPGAAKLPTRSPYAWISEFNLHWKRLARPKWHSRVLLACCFVSASLQEADEEMRDSIWAQTRTPGAVWSCNRTLTLSVPEVMLLFHFPGPQIAIPTVTLDLCAL